MNYLPQFATGKCYCDDCNGATVQGRKVGKTFYCIRTYKAMKTKEQIDKAKDRNKVRMLSNSNSGKSTYQRPEDNKLVDNSAAKKLRQLSDQRKWFEERRKEMTGKCLLCSGKTEKDNDVTFRHSIAHLLPKKDNFGGFPSVATHPDNWLELCYYNNSCHTNFDTSMIDWQFLRTTNEWPIIVSKFKKVYPFIAEKEKRNIPVELLTELI